MIMESLRKKTFGSGRLREKHFFKKLLKISALSNC